MKRNLVIYGNIYTADKKNPGAAALAISEGKFAYVGDEEGVKEYIGKDTEVIRFDKGIILPGFGEGHGHITPGGTEKTFLCPSETHGHLTAASVCNKSVY